MLKMKRKSKKKKSRLDASFTVEAALVVPMIVLIIVVGIHLAIELEYIVAEQAEREPAVELLNPIEEMYKGY